MAKQIKAAVIAALVVFVTAVTFGAPIGALGTFAMSTATTMAVMTFGTTLLGGIIGKMTSKGIDATGGNFGTKFAARSSLAPRQIIYGKTRVGGTIVYMSTSGTENSILHMIVVLAGHPIESLEEVRLNDVTLTTQDTTVNGVTVKLATNSQYTNTDNDNAFHSGRLVRFLFQDGSQTTANSHLASAPGLTTNDKFLSCPHVYMEMVFDGEKFGGGIPGLSFIVKGKKLYDPRLDSTVGGSGSHRLTDTSTHEWSDNPALAVLDYLTDTTYGLKCTQEEVHLSTNAGGFMSAANTCEQSVTLSNNVSTQERFTVNGFTDFSSEGEGILDGLLSSMAGRMTYVNGKFNVFAGAVQTPSLTITDDDILRPVKIATNPNAGNLFNQVKPIYVSAARDYVTQDAPVFSDSTALANDTPSGESSANYKKIMELQLPFTVTDSMAQRLGKIALKHQRETTSVVVTTDLKFMRLQPNDWVYLTNERLEYNQKVFEVLSTNMELISSETRDQESVQVLATRLELKEINNAVFDFATNEYNDPIDEGGNPGDGDYSVGVPTSLTLTQRGAIDGPADKSHILVNWTNVAADTIAGTQVVYKLNTDSDYTGMIPATKLQDSTIIPGVVTGQTYNVKARHVDINGNFSDYTAVQNITITNTASPDDPTNLSATSRPVRIFVSWTNPSNTNLRSIKVYRRTSNTTPTDDTHLVQTLSGEPGKTMLARYGAEDGLTAGTTYYFWIRAVNHFGIHSNFVGSVQGVFQLDGGVVGLNNLGDLDSSQNTKLTNIEDNATVGAKAGVNLKDSGNTVLDDVDFRNEDLAIDFTGNTTFRIKKGSTVIDTQAFDKGNVGLSDLDSLESGTGTKLSGIEAGATVGAKAGTNLKDSSNNALGDDDVKNDSLQIDTSTTTLRIKKGSTVINSTTLDKGSVGLSDLASLDSAQNTKLTGIEANATVGAKLDDNLVDENNNDLTSAEIVTSQGTSNDTNNVNSVAKADITASITGTQTNVASIVNNLAAGSQNINAGGINAGQINTSLLKLDELFLPTTGTNASGTLVLFGSSMTQVSLGDIGTGPGFYMGTVSVEIDDANNDDIKGASLHIDLKSGFSTVYTKYWPIGIKEGNQYYDAGDQLGDNNDLPVMHLEFAYFHTANTTLNLFVNGDSNDNGTHCNIKARVVKFGAETVSFNTSSFTATKTNQTAGANVDSGTVTVSGFTGSKQVNLSGNSSALVSVNGGTFVNAASVGTITSGQTFEIRITASSTAGITRTATVEVGGTSVTYSVTTAGTYTPTYSGGGGSGSPGGGFEDTTQLQ